ncbi:MAG: YdcF family protein [Myxococcota bacterium]
MRVRIGAAAVAGLALVWVGLAWSLDRYGQRAPRHTYDAIVVAGCRVDPDGTPSQALQRRTRLAVDLWRAGVAPRLVFTGGVGTYPPAEADAAATYAEALGVPPEVIAREARSTSTEENARYAAELVGPEADVVVVTDAYHVFRAERVFGRWFDRVEGAGSVPRLDVRVRGSLREVVAIADYAVTGRLW